MPYNQQEMMEKQCPGCLLRLPWGDFYKNRVSRDGLTASCKTCINTRSRARYLVNREAILATCKQYYETHKEQAAAWGRARHAANREQILLKVAAWQAAHPERVAATKRRWVAAHREQARSVAKHAQQRRRADKRNSGGSFTAAQWSAKLSYYNNHCAYCLRLSDKLTMDHMVPLSRGGEHSDENIVPACGSCNSRKSARTPLEFLLAS